MNVIETLEKAQTDRQATCKHIFINGYNAVSGELYKGCSLCGIEIDHIKVETNDSEPRHMMHPLCYMGGEQLNLDFGEDHGKESKEREKA